MKRKSLYILLLFLFSLQISNSQEFDLNPEKFKTLPGDTSTMYYKEVWLVSKDINRNDAGGFARRAYDKARKGLYIEALSDIDRSVAIDSTNAILHSLRGYIFLRMRSFDNAIASFRKATSLNDTSCYTYYYEAAAFIELRMIKEADSLLTRSILIDNKFTDGYFLLGNLYFSTMNPDKAEINYKKTTDLDPHFAPAYFNLALIHIRKDPQKSLKYLSDCIKEDPGFMQAYLLRASIYISQGKNNIGLENLEKAIELAPDNLQLKIFKMLSLIHISKFDEAYRNTLEAFDLSRDRTKLASFINRNSNDRLNIFLLQIEAMHQFENRLTPSMKRELLFAIGSYGVSGFFPVNSMDHLLNSQDIRGLVYYILGSQSESVFSMDDAQQYYSLALQQKEFPFDVYFRLAKSYFNNGKYYYAGKNLEVYMNKENDNREAYLIRGKLNVRAIKYLDAIADFSKCIALDSSRVEPFYLRADCYWQLEKYDKAVSDLNYILLNDPFNMESICLLADCRFQSGDTTAAYRILNESAGKYGRLNEKGNLLRGTINLCYKNYDFAIRDFNNILKFNSYNAEAFVYRGLAYYCKEHFEEAIADFTSAIRLDSKNITALYTRGMAYIKTNKPGEAYKDLRDAESLGHPLAKRAILIYLRSYVGSKEQSDPVKN